MALRFLRLEPEVKFGTHIDGGEDGGTAERGTFADFVVGPDKPHQFPRLMAGMGASQITAERFSSREFRLFCYGWIGYLDIFNKSHPIVFCRRYRIEAADWEPVGGKTKNYTG
jgi:hypothetical protein